MFIDMVSELRGSVKDLPFPLAKTLIKRAWQDVRRQNLWSFQLYDANWISPALVNDGTVAVTQGSNSVTFDATALAALNTSNSAFNLVINRQFRVGASTIYNIIAYDSGTGVATLDRIYTDSTDADTVYQVYQLYYAPPFQDHRTFVSVRDMTNFTDLILERNRAWLDEQDPQRSFYYFPTHVVFYANNAISDSQWYKYPMFELWGVPLSNRSYQLYGIRNGAELSANSDTLPVAVTEECVVERAKLYAYEWAEANKPYGMTGGPDFKFLMGQADARYKELFRKERMLDRDLVDNWFRIRRSSLYAKYMAYYNATVGTAFPGVAG